MGAASTIQQFTRNISELRLSFLLCNYDVYSGKRIDNFFFYVKLPILGKNTKAILYNGIAKKWGSEVGNKIERILVRMYVCMS